MRMGRKEGRKQLASKTWGLTSNSDPLKAIKMEGAVPHRRSSSYLHLPGCITSPSCIPTREEIEYSRIHCGTSNVVSSSRRSRKWRNFITKLVKDSKSSIYGSKPSSFHYDPVSYSQNFDEGCHSEDYSSRHHCRPKAFGDVRWEL